jgi:hypothetical protein
MYMYHLIFFYLSNVSITDYSFLNLFSYRLPDNVPGISKKLFMYKFLHWISLTPCSYTYNKPYNNEIFYNDKKDNRLFPSPPGISKFKSPYNMNKTKSKDLSLESLSNLFSSLFFTATVQLEALVRQKKGSTCMLICVYKCIYKKTYIYKYTYISTEESLFNVIQMKHCHSFVFIIQSDGLGIAARGQNTFTPSIPVKEMNTKSEYPTPGIRLTPGIILDQSNEEEKDADGYGSSPRVMIKEGNGPYPKGPAPKGGGIDINSITKV